MTVLSQQFEESEIGKAVYIRLKKLRKSIRNKTLLSQTGELLFRKNKTLQINERQDHTFRKGGDLSTKSPPTPPGAPVSTR